MTDIIFIEVKNNLSIEKCDTNESDPLTDTSGNSSTERSERINYKDDFQGDFAPLDNCCHSIFGADTSNWTETTIKIEKDAESESTKSETNKNNLKYEVNVKKEGTVFSSSSCGSKQSHQSVSSDTKVLLSKNAYKQYEAILKAKIKCPNCFFTTSNRGNLKQHMKKHEKPPGYVYTCDICNFKTKYKNSMKSHAARHEKGRSGSFRRKKE